MAKEITIDMLAETSKPVQKPIEEINDTVEVTETVMSGEQNVQEKPSVEISNTNAQTKPNNGVKMGTGKIDRSKMKPMSASEMAQQLIKDGVMEPKKDETEEHPVMQNAFDALTETIKERERNIDNLLETMRDNAEEDRKKKEFGLDDDYDDEDEDTGNSDIESELERQQNYSSDDSNKKSSKVKDDFDFDDDDDPKPVKKEEEKKPVEFDDEDDDDEDEEDSSNLNSDIAELDGLLKATNTSSSDNDTEDDDTDIPETPRGPENDREMIEKFKKSFKGVKIIRDPIDLSKFTISDKPESNKLILKSIESSEAVRRADWALYHTQRSMTFKECSGPELDALRKIMENANDVNRVKASLEFIYSHVYDSNKPPFEEWTKLIRTEDVDNMYFGIYKACYADSNLIPRTCNKCGKTSLIETAIDKMPVYGRIGDDPVKIKKEFNRILNQDSTTAINPFKSELLQISDEYVVAFSPASLYSTFILYSTLDADVTERFAETLNTMSYIDKFFHIDRENSTLRPIKVKEYKDDLNKSVRSKLRVYSDVLNTLSTDQYNAFMSKLNTLVGLSKIHYIMPKCVCPECGEEIPEAEVDSMLNLLFIRAQLARIVSL